MIDHLPLPPARHSVGQLVVPVTVAAATAWVESYNRRVKYVRSIEEYNTIPWEDGGGIAALNPWPAAAVSWPDDDVVAFQPYLESARRTKQEAEAAPRHPWSLVLYVRGLGYKQHDRLIDLGDVYAEAGPSPYQSWLTAASWL